MKARTWSATERKFKEDCLDAAHCFSVLVSSLVMSLGKDNGGSVWLDDSSIKEFDAAAEHIVEIIKSARVVTRLTIVK